MFHLPYLLVSVATVVIGRKIGALSVRDDVSQCAINCIVQSGFSEGCTDFTNLQCICTNGLFLQAALACVQDQCSADDVQTAFQLYKDECGASADGTVPAMPTTTGNSSVVGGSVSSTLDLPSAVPATSSAHTSSNSTATTPAGWSVSSASQSPARPSPDASASSASPSTAAPPTTNGSPITPPTAVTEVSPTSPPNPAPATATPAVSVQEASVAATPTSNAGKKSMPFGWSDVQARIAAIGGLAALSTLVGTFML